MSKKIHQLKRLDSLFIDLEGEAAPFAQMPLIHPSAVSVEPLSGWTWELDSEGNYASVSPELSMCLGLSPVDVIGRPMRTYRLHPQSLTCVSEALDSLTLPTETIVNIQHEQGHWVPVRITVLSAPENGTSGAWKGFAQLLPVDETVSQEPPEEVPSLEKNPYPNAELTSVVYEIPTSAVRTEQPPSSFGAFQGVTVDAFGKNTASQPMTRAGVESLARSEVVSSQASANQPAALAVPLKTGEMGDLLVEIVDDIQNRSWTEEERLLVTEITSQLSLALENARLYNAAQQELADRVRAEQVILHRNQDLAALNQIGQRLNSLASRAEVLNTLVEMVGQVLDNRNLYICLFDQRKGIVSFPIYREDGQPVSMPDRPLDNELGDYIINTHTSLLITEHSSEKLRDLGIVMPARVPASVMALPITAGDHLSGALVVQDFDQINAPQFDTIHLELLSTAVSQASTSLENSKLFEQMQEALRAIENRERYQGGVAQAAASLSEMGIQALPDVLKYLGHASLSNRVYLVQAQSTAQDSPWKLIEDWTSPSVAYLFDRGKIHEIPYNTFAQYIEGVRSDGWVEIQAQADETQAGPFLRGQNIKTTLLMSVSAKDSSPSLLVFDQIDRPRRWLNDEIKILQVAADAIANSYIRENLLSQIQVNLNETETLYKASNRLVQAGDIQEMLASVISGVKTTGFNRAVLTLFEHDIYGKINQISIQGNWYSGYGTPPSPVGTGYPLDAYARFLSTNSPVFVEDVTTASLDEALQKNLLSQNIRSIANLPLWSGKRQVGALLVEGEARHSFSSNEMRTLPPLVDQLTITVENLRLFEQTQTALAETALLYNISSSIAQSQDTDDMVRLVVENVLPRGADRASLFAASHEDTGEIIDLEIVGYRDLGGNTNLKGMRLKLSELPILRTLTDEGLTIPDVNAPEVDAVSRQTLRHCDTDAIAFVPLRSGGRLIGLLSASSRKATQFDPADIRLLRTVGNGIAVAIEKQRLLRQAQRRALELQTASEITRDTTSTLSLDLLLNRIVNLLSERFNYPHTSIYFIDETGNFAILRESTGKVGSELKQSGHKLMVGSRSVVGTVTSTGEPLILNDISNSSIYMAHPLLQDTRSEMAIPLRIGKRVIGALDIQSNSLNAFAPDDINVLGILTDQISIAIENARAYELSQKAIEDMREVDRVKSQFLANMSHELRTPLNSIIGFSRVILKGIDGPVNDTQEQDLSAIYNSGQHLLLLINDILDLSKIEAGKMELSFSEVSLPDMITSAMSTAVGLVKDKQIKLITNAPKDLPNVRGDSTRIRQVLINFLSNAAKFTEEGSITVQADQVTSPLGVSEIMVTVADTGPGIAEIDQSKLFLPFSQVDDSPTRKTGGSGLGLSICRSLIEMHNGRIGLLESEVGKGSTFFFTLPLVEQPGSGLNLPSSSTGNGIVLAIDDDSQVISLYQRYLQPQGYTVIPQTNPRTAVKAARDLQPMAITLDVMMPDQDGWQVMRELKNDPLTRDIPIIVCSILEEEEKGFSLGAADYLVKPFLQDELLNSIDRLNQDGEIHKILVIDDDEDDLRLIQKMFEDNKTFKVSQAKGGQSGWERIQNEPPDAVILDLLMPDMDGFTLLSNLRSRKDLQDIPVIILTGADLTSEQHQQLSEFGKRLLTKGYLRQKELLTAIEQTLRKIHPVKLMS